MKKCFNIFLEFFYNKFEQRKFKLFTMRWYAERVNYLIIKIKLVNKKSFLILVAGP